MHYAHFLVFCSFKVDEISYCHYRYTIWPELVMELLFNTYLWPELVMELLFHTYLWPELVMELLFNTYLWPELVMELLFHTYLWPELVMELLFNTYLWPRLVRTMSAWTRATAAGRDGSLVRYNIQNIFSTHEVVNTTVRKPNLFFTLPSTAGEIYCHSLLTVSLQ